MWNDRCASSQLPGAACAWVPLQFDTSRQPVGACQAAFPGHAPLFKLFYHISTHSKKRIGIAWNAFFSNQMTSLLLTDCTTPRRRSAPAQRLKGLGTEANPLPCAPPGPFTTSSSPSRYHPPQGDDLHLHNGSKNLARAGFDYTAAYYPVQQDQAVSGADELVRKFTL